MNREIFLKKLEELLESLPTEERENALIYYTDYFDDAGVADEARIIDELGSPERVANMLLREYHDLKGNKQEGEYTEYGYVDPNIEKDPFEVTVESDLKNDTHQRKEQSNQRQYDQQKNRDTRSYRRTKRSDNYGLWILIIVLSFPIWFTIAATGFGVLIGLIAGGIGLTAGLVGGGIICLTIGFAQLIVLPMEGILALGAGLILIGIGSICGTMLIKGGFYGIKGIIKGLNNFFQGRRVNRYEREK